MSLQSIEVIPGIGPKQDFIEIEKRVQLVVPYIDWVHIDIADNKLVPNLTLLDPLPFQKLIEETGKKFELHMMVEDPLDIATSWIQVGFKRVLFHVEAMKNVSSLKYQILSMKGKGIEIGLAINSGTPAESVFPYLDEIACVLIMTIKAGFSGQTFIPEMLEKVKILKSKKPELPIGVDGGINDATGKLAVEAGANRLVSTSFIYNSENTEKAIWTLKNLNS